MADPYMKMDAALSKYFNQQSKSAVCRTTGCVLQSSCTLMSIELLPVVIQLLIALRDIRCPGELPIGWPHSVIDNCLAVRQLPRLVSIYSELQPQPISADGCSQSKMAWISTPSGEYKQVIGHPFYYRSFKYCMHLMVYTLGQQFQLLTSTCTSDGTSVSKLGHASTWPGVCVQFKALILRAWTVRGAVVAMGTYGQPHSNRYNDCTCN